MSLGLALGCVYGVGLSNLFAIWRLSWLTEAMNKRTFWYYRGHVHVMAGSSGMMGILQRSSSASLRYFPKGALDQGLNAPHKFYA